MTVPRTDRHAPVSLDFFDAQRRRLLSLAYRMLGSRAEAEDIVQDAWLRWHTSDTAALREPAAWLTTVITRLSIDRLRTLRTERAAQENGWLPDMWVDLLVPSAEDQVLDGAQLTYGLMLLLERLSPDERAAFLLREAFDCDYATISAAIGKQPDHCRQLIHRAKARLARAGAPPKPADAVRQRHIVDQLRHAIAAQDHESLLHVLNGVQVVGDTREPVVAIAQAEALSMDEEAGVAFFVDGDVTALLVPACDARGKPMMRIVTQPSAIAAVNDIVGRAAVVRLLADVFREAGTTTRCVASA